LEIASYFPLLQLIWGTLTQTTSLKTKTTQNYGNPDGRTAGERREDGGLQRFARHQRPPVQVSELCAHFFCPFDIIPFFVNFQN
jgi:hypothetical protein